MRFRYRREWRLPLGPADLWSRLERTDCYPAWWPWLRGSDLPQLATGTTATFTVAPPLPYHLDLRLRLVDVEPGRRIDTVVDGDLAGRASLELEPDGPDHTRVVLRWDVDVDRPSLQALARVAWPLLGWGHEMVVRAAVVGFATAQGLDPDEVVPVPPRSNHDARRPIARVVADGLWAGAAAAVISGAPSTVAAVVRHRSGLEASRAAGTLLGAPTLPRAVVAHGAVALAWGIVLSAALPRDHRLATGTAAGAAIAAIDLGAVAPRSFPAVAALPVLPQLADHLLYGAVVGMVLERRAVRWTGVDDDRLSPEPDDRAPEPRGAASGQVPGR